MKNENKTGSTLLVTHSDRDGLFSGAALLRALDDPDGPGVITIARTRQ